jgi:hypothetical protein
MMAQAHPRRRYGEVSRASLPGSSYFSSRNLHGSTDDSGCLRFGLRVEFPMSVDHLEKLNTKKNRRRIPGFVDYDKRLITDAA